MRTGGGHRYTPDVETLWQQIISTTDRATKNGSLVTLPTSKTVVNEAGIPFVIHISELQERKARVRKPPTATPFNPFLPPDPALFICDLPPRHAGVLNKFNVLRHHLLIVTRDFEPQENLLDRGDFEALGHCMSLVDGLGFYNGGTVAGASQAHKHLQLVPLPIGEGAAPTPLDAVIDEPGRPGGLHTLSALPFSHSLVPLDGRPLSGNRATELEAHYRAACEALGIHDESQPYNLLLTRRWMLVVPRSREFWNRVSVNALGFAGSLLVRNRNELAAVQETGPLAILRSVVEPSP